MGTILYFAIVGLVCYLPKFSFTGSGWAYVGMALVAVVLSMAYYDLNSQLRDWKHSAIYSGISVFWHIGVYPFLLLKILTASVPPEAVYISAIGLYIITVQQSVNLYWSIVDTVNPFKQRIVREAAFLDLSGNAPKESKEVSPMMKGFAFGIALEMAKKELQKK